MLHNELCIHSSMRVCVNRIKSTLYESGVESEKKWLNRAKLNTIVRIFVAAVAVATAELASLK